MACIVNKEMLSAEMEAGNFTKEEEEAARQKLVNFRKDASPSNILMVMAMTRMLSRNGHLKRDCGSEG